MHSNQIKIIFVDVDWTLYDHKRKGYNKSGLRAINKAHKKAYEKVEVKGFRKGHVPASVLEKKRMIL